jgi:hypothetical protein
MHRIGAGKVQDEFTPVRHTQDVDHGDCHETPCRPCLTAAASLLSGCATYDDYSYYDRDGYYEDDDYGDRYDSRRYYYDRYGNRVYYNDMTSATAMGHYGNARRAIRLRPPQHLPLGAVTHATTTPTGAPASTASPISRARISA